MGVIISQTNAVVLARNPPEAAARAGAATAVLSVLPWRLMPSSPEGRGGCASPPAPCRAGLAGDALNLRHDVGHHRVRVLAVQDLVDALVERRGQLVIALAGRTRRPGHAHHVLQVLQERLGLD